MSTKAKGPGWAVVTGASSGLGYEFARQLAVGGREVVAVARRGERLERLRDEVGARVRPLTLDVTAPDAAAAIRDATSSLKGDGWVVNNAGTARSGPFAAWPSEQHAATVRLNCEAMVAVTGALLPRLLDRDAGVILNVGSLAAFQPMPFAGSVYGGTKALVVSFSEALSLELEGTGVSVTAFCPGPVETEIHTVGAPGVQRKRKLNELTPERAVRFAIAAAERGRVVAVPGPFNRVRLSFTQKLPRSTLRWMMGRLGATVVGYPRQATVSDDKAAAKALVDG